MPISSSAQRSSQTHPPRRGINNTKNKKRKAIAGGLIPTSFPSVPSPSAYYGSPPPGAALTFPTGPSSAYASSAFDHGFFRPAESAGGGSVSRPSFAVKLKPPSGPSGYSGGGPKTRAPTYHPAGSGDSFPFEKLKPPSGPSGYSGGGPKTRAPTYPFGIISSPLGQLKPPSGPSGFTGGGPKTRAPTVFRGDDDEEYYYNHQQHPLQHPPPSHGYHQHSDSFYNIPPSACFYQGVSASQLRNGFGGGCHADYFFQQQPVRDHYRGRFSSWPQHVSSPHHHFLHSPDEYYEEESDNEFTHNHGDGHESANDNDDDDCEDDGNDKNDDNDEEEDVEEDSHQPQQPQHKNTKRPTTTTPCHAPDGSWYATSNSSSSSTSDVGDWDLAKEDEDETEDERVRQKINIHKAAIHKIKQKKRNSSRHSLFVSAPRNKKSRRTCNFIDDEALETNDKVDEESEDNLEDFGNDDKEDTEVGEESEFEFVDDKEDDHPPHFNDEEDDHADNQGKEFPALFESSSDDDDFPTVPSQYPALFESSDDETLENNVTDGASDTATLQTQTSNIVAAANPAMQPRTIFDCPIITSFPRPSFSKSGSFDDFHDKVWFQEVIRNACIHAPHTVPKMDSVRENSGPSVGLCTSQGLTRSRNESFAVPGWLAGTHRYMKVFDIVSRTTKSFLESANLSDRLPGDGSPKQKFYNERCQDLCKANLYLSLSFKVYVHHPKNVQNHDGHFRSHRDRQNPDRDSPNDFMFCAWDTWFEPLLNLNVTGTIIACGRRSQEELFERMLRIETATAHLLTCASFLPSDEKAIEESLLCPDGSEFIIKGSHLLQIHALTPNHYIHQLHLKIGKSGGLSAYLAVEIIIAFHQTSNNALRFHRFMNDFLDKVNTEEDLRDYVGEMNIVELFQKYCYEQYGGYEGTTNRLSQQEGVVRHQSSVACPVSLHENQRSMRSLVRTLGLFSSGPFNNSRYLQLVKQVKEDVLGFGDLKGQKAIVTLASLGLFIPCKYLEFFATGCRLQQMKNLRRFIATSPHPQAGYSADASGRVHLFLVEFRTVCTKCEKEAWRRNHIP